jgi:hypothetical protein
VSGLRRSNGQAWNPAGGTPPDQQVC